MEFSREELHDLRIALIHVQGEIREALRYLPVDHEITAEKIADNARYEALFKRLVLENPDA